MRNSRERSDPGLRQETNEELSERLTNTGTSQGSSTQEMLLQASDPELGPAYSPQSLLSPTRPPACPSRTAVLSGPALASPACSLTQSLLAGWRPGQLRVDKRGASQTESHLLVNSPPRAGVQLSGQQPQATTQGEAAGRHPCPSGGSMEDVPPAAAAYSSKDGGSNGWTRKPKQERRR